MPAEVTAAQPQRSGALPLAAAGAGGALVALQARVNGELGVELGSALLAALVSFATGLAAVAAVVLGRPAARRAVARLHDVPRWTLLGGLGGASLIAAGAAAAPRIGVALFTVGIVAGQTAGGLVVDRVGLGPGGPRPLSAARVVGALLCLGAVSLGAFGAAPGHASALLVGLVVAAGFLVSVATALNGRVRAGTGHAAVATLANFVVGASALGLATGLAAGAGGLSEPDWPGTWWLYVGGPLGAAFVAVAAVVVRRLGVLRLGLVVVAGQLAGGVLLDLALPVAEGPVRPLTLAAVAVTFLAVAVSGRVRS